MFPRPSDPTDLSDEELTAILRASHREDVACDGWPTDRSVQDDAARALAELYRRHRAAVLAYARRFASAYIADDLASEAFTRTLHAVRQGAGPTGSWRPYLCVVVRNTAAQDAKAQRTHVPLADFEAWSESLPDTTEPERTLLRNEETRLLIRSFRSLPERWQAVLWHRLVDGRATAEVAPLLGMTPSGVSTLLARAQEGLRTAYLQAHIREGGDAECRHYAGLMGSAARNRGKRHRGLMRHLDGCDRCSTAFADIEHLNARLRALAPFALLFGWGGADLSGSTVSGSSSAATKASGGSTAPGAGWMAAHPWLLSVAAASAVGAATAASVIAFTGSGLTTVANSKAAPRPAVSPTTAPIAGALSPARTTAAAQEPIAEPSQASLTPKPSPTRPPTRVAPAPSRSAAPAPSRSAADLSAEGRLLTLLNERRRGLGLPDVERSDSLARAARTCVQKNAQQANLEHCGHEVLFTGGIGTPPERIIESWFNSPGHRKALTYPGSRNAGPAIVTNAEGTAIFAAINIDT